MHATDLLYDLTDVNIREFVWPYKQLINKTFVVFIHFIQLILCFIFF